MAKRRGNEFLPERGKTSGNFHPWETEVFAAAENYFDHEDLRVRADRSARYRMELSVQDLEYGESSSDLFLSLLFGRFALSGRFVAILKSRFVKLS